VVIMGAVVLDADTKLSMVGRWKFVELGFDSDASARAHIDLNRLGFQAMLAAPLGLGPGSASSDLFSDPNSKALIWTESTWIKIAIEEGMPFAITILAITGWACWTASHDPARMFAWFTVSCALTLVSVGISFPVGLYLSNSLLPGLIVGSMLGGQTRSGMRQRLECRWRLSAGTSNLLTR